jgi:hypothetical protein
VFSACGGAPGGAAEDDYRQAFALAEKFELRRLVAYWQLGLGKLDHRPDRQEEGVPGRRLYGSREGYERSRPRFDLTIFVL